MVKPNFFIVGAPKCGTTALYEYLSSHPNVFMAYSKEPCYFNTDMQNRIYIEMNDYLKLYSDCSSHHTIIGEASAIYLYSSEALQNIHHFNQDVKIIIMLRNPIDMVYSLFGQFRYELIEDQKNFEIAWDLQKKRAEGHQLPPSCLEPKLLQYGQIGKFGEQLQRAYSIFPKKQIKVILLDDFIADTKKVYLEVLSFLGLEDDARSSFPKINEHKAFKVYWLQYILRCQPPIIRRLVNKFRPVRSFKDLIMNSLINWNNVKTQRPPLSASFRQELADYFRDDVKKLSQLLDRDLMHWVE
jgi:hypothetical protein